MSQDLRALLHAVSNPTSHPKFIQDQQTLTELFKQPECLIALQALSADRSLPQHERHMASVVTARELKTKWRSKALVPEARKPEVRERLFSFLEEPDTAIARPQLGLLVAVARIEYPRAWQNLPQLMLNPLLACMGDLDQLNNPSSPTSIVLLNILWTINALVKEWRTVKVSHGALVMQTFEDVFAEPVGRVLAYWGEQERSGHGDWALGEAGRYSFKLRTIGQPQSEKLLRSLTKHLRATGKWWRVMLGIDPKGFCKVEGVTSGVGWWWGEVGGVVAGTDGTVANEVFNPQFILSAFHLLVDKLLPLTSTDLEALEDEPEDWLIGESFDEEAWSFEFRRES
ncbi:hypothetical protein IAU60_001116 [Kwoniella sp. DSM 27419]